MFKNEGITGFYKGLLPSLLMTTNPIIQFTLYEILRKKILNYGELTRGGIVLISIISKLITTFITYPMLTIKTLFQANETKTDQQVFEVISNILKTDGSFGLYKGKQLIYYITIKCLGMYSKLFQNLLNAVILMVVHEKILKFFAKYFIK